MKNIKFLPHISELLLICVLDKWQDEWKDLFSKIMPKRFWIFFFYLVNKKINMFVFKVFVCLVLLYLYDICIRVTVIKFLP